jgi:putative ABC transport system permease protein
MFQLSLKNLLRNKRRTFLTTASVALTLILVCLLGAVLMAMESAEGAADNRVVVRSAISLTFTLPEAYGQRLQQIDHVEAITPLNWFGGIYKDERPENFFAQFSTDPQTLLDVYPEYQIPPDQVAAWQAERTAFITGKALADKYGWKLGDQIFVKGSIYPLDLNLTLRGIFTEPNAPAAEKSIFFHRMYLEEALGNPGQVGTFFLRIDSPDNVAAVVQAAESMFENSEAQVRAETEKAFSLSFLEMMGNVRMFLGAIGAAIVVSLLFITANTMAMAARERTNEVAVLKTLGFRRGHVVRLLLFESVAVGVGGALVGLAIAVALVKGAAAALQNVFPIFGTLAVTPPIATLALVLGLFIGLVSGGFPALQAARMTIVDGLRKLT